MRVKGSNAASSACHRAGSRGGSRLLNFGIVGSIVTALCCFTPVLVVLLGLMGLSAALGWLDVVLLPALGIFVVITGYALWQQRHARSS